jgi:hypothetical protein
MHASSVNKSMYLTACLCLLQNSALISETKGATEMSQQTSDHIRRYAVENYVSPARKSGMQEFEIIVGEVHRGLRMQNRVPQVCAALRSNKFLTDNRLALVGESGPASGMSTTVRLKYRFLERVAASAHPGSVSGSPPLRETSIYHKIRDLYGIAGEVYRSMGGGERTLTEEREHFYGDPGELNQAAPRPR